MQYLKSSDGIRAYHGLSTEAREKQRGVRNPRKAAGGQLEPTRLTVHGRGSFRPSSSSYSFTDKPSRFRHAVQCVTDLWNSKFAKRTYSTTIV